MTTIPSGDPPGFDSAIRTVIAMLTTYSDGARDERNEMALRLDHLEAQLALIVAVRFAWAFVDRLAEVLDRDPLSMIQSIAMEHALQQEGLNP